MGALRATWMPWRLRFKFEARTSRAVMHCKDTYFVKVWREDNPGRYGLGECALFRGLSREDDDAYESRLSAACANPEGEFGDSSIRFGFETALANLEGAFPQGRHIPIPINGLVWMGDKELMRSRIEQKLLEGFRCIKLKIGGIDFDDELDLLRFIRKRFPRDVLELRVDANGAFSPEDALAKLERLATFDLHSIEQPIAAGNHAAMARICRESPVPVALDEELIGMTPNALKDELLGEVRPQYIVLKPSLCGGFAESDRWIEVARRHGIGWWATSALESNIGLEAIARWLGKYDVSMPQGLGTGELYHNNVGDGVVRRGAYVELNDAATPPLLDFDR